MAGKEMAHGQGSDAHNVGTAERWLSAFLGGVLAAVGLSRRGAAGVAAAIAGGALILRGASGYSLVYDSLNLTTAGKKDREARIQTAVTVSKAADEVYGFWRNFENHPRFMHYIDSVTVRDEKHSHWRLKGPLDVTFEWESEVTEDRPGEYIAWRSLEGSDIEQSGRVTFGSAPGGRGTVVDVTLEVIPPGGMLVSATNPLLKVLTENQLRADLMRFKQIMEAGEVATANPRPSEGS